MDNSSDPTTTGVGIREMEYDGPGEPSSRLLPSRPLVDMTPNPSAIFSETCSSVASDDDDDPEENFGDDNGKRKKYSWKTRMIEVSIVQCLVYVIITLGVQIANPLTPPTTSIASEGLWKDVLSNNSSIHDCVYVPGGGFSGFWFSLGRLQTLEDPYHERFVCYSAGCLGVVGTLIHQASSTTTDDAPLHYRGLYDMARSIQVDWLNGHKHRYRITETFVHNLVEPLEIGLLQDQAWAKDLMEIFSENLMVVTTSYDRGWPSSIIPQAVSRRPKNVEELKEMLWQTTWIPIATGSSWTHKGHMDGAFSMAQHPKCARTVGVELASFSNSLEKLFVLWSNALNPNLQQRQVEELWNIGLEIGV